MTKVKTKLILSFLDQRGEEILPTGYVLDHIVPIPAVGEKVVIGTEREWEVTERSFSYAHFVDEFETKITFWCKQ